MPISTGKQQNGNEPGSLAQEIKLFNLGTLQNEGPEAKKLNVSLTESKESSGAEPMQQAGKLGWGLTGNGFDYPVGKRPHEFLKKMRLRNLSVLLKIETPA